MTDYERLVADRWEQIKCEGVRSPGGWRSMTLPITAHGRALIQAVDEVDEHHLLVPADATGHPENTRSPLAMSFREFRFSTGENPEVEGRYFDIHCRLRALNTQFDKVIGEVVAAVEGAAHPVAAAATTLAMWRRLFTTLADSRPLTHREKLAAFGELSVLLDLIGAFPGFRAASWTGPERQPHDFELDSLSIEVKSIGDDSQTITVHGLTQLDRVDGKPLYLMIRRIIEDSGGQTLPELLSEVLAACDDPSIVRQRAALLGVYETMSDSTRFEVAESLIGEVTDDFPRITEEILGPALTEMIAHVDYDVRLTDAQRWLVPGSADLLQEGRL